jgi:hypothetical protein
MEMLCGGHAMKAGCVEALYGNVVWRTCDEGGLCGSSLWKCCVEDM